MQVEIGQAPPPSSFSGIMGSGYAFPTSDGWFSIDHKQRVWPADVNGDGRTDLVGIDPVGNIYYALSNGDGTFSHWQHAVGNGFTIPGQWFLTDTRDRVWPADVTGNGRDDLVGVAFNGTISTILNQGNGVFSDMIGSGYAFPTSDGWFSIDHKQRVWPADINGDGRTDLVGIDLGGNIYYALSNGDGTFSHWQHAVGNGFTTPDQWFLTDTRDRVWPADVTGNGRDDLVGVAFSGTIATMLNLTQ